MKRTVSIILLVISMVFFCGVAFADSSVLFRDIPWLSSPADVRHIGFADNEAAQFYLSDDILIDMGTVKPIDEQLPYNQLETTTPTCFKIGVLTPDVGLNVAGYNVDITEIIFAYDIDVNGSVLSSPADLQFICSQYVFDSLDEASSAERAMDIERKLTNIYGTPSNSDEHIVTWKDEDGNTIIFSKFSYFTSLLYRYYDADELIKQAYDAAKKQASTPVDNMNGL